MTVVASSVTVSDTISQASDVRPLPAQQHAQHEASLVVGADASEICTDGVVTGDVTSHTSGADSSSFITTKKHNLPPADRLAGIMGVGIDAVDDLVDNVYYELSHDANPPSQRADPPSRRGLGSDMGLFFTLKPQLDGSLFEGAPAVPLERCAHRFEPLHQLQPFMSARQLPLFSSALLTFIIFMASTLIFFNICTTQWFHLLFTVPLIFFIVCEMTFGDRSAFRRA